MLVWLPGGTMGRGRGGGSSGVLRAGPVGSLRVCRGPMDIPADKTPTQCLESLNRGDRSAIKRLFPLIYDELRVLAGAMMREERAGHTLQPTALVHEAYLRLVEYERMDWKGKAHFFAVAAQAIRRVLVDHARRQKAVKRGGGAGALPATIMLEQELDSTSALDLIELNDLLTRLAGLSGRQARIVELRFFGGLSLDEIAHVLGVSRTTVSADWAVARAWLLVELAGEGRS
jgi:RNA polymerase sigma-70 factor, ECF subfamily